MRQHQHVAFLHAFPHQRLDRLGAELLERGDTLVAVDDQVALLLGDDDDRRLLAGLSQGCQQAPGGAPADAPGGGPVGETPATGSAFGVARAPECGGAHLVLSGEVQLFCVTLLIPSG